MVLYIFLNYDNYRYYSIIEITVDVVVIVIIIIIIIIIIIWRWILLSFLDKLSYSWWDIETYLIYEILKSRSDDTDEPALKSSQKT